MSSKSSSSSSDGSASDRSAISDGSSAAGDSLIAGSSAATDSAAGELHQASTLLAKYRVQVDARLEQLVPAETIEPVTVHQAIRWSLLGGGKRLRPALLIASGEVFGQSAEMLLPTACAFELLHTYSLIHDDLPAMDDDDLRRGRPTCHVRFGEATAILAGDALQALAFQTIAEDAQLSPDVRVRVISEIAQAAGTPAGMVAGQAYDLAAEGRVVSGEQLDIIHRFKTGRLITAAARCGALIAQAGESDVTAVSAYAVQLGLLFQITDDLLDVVATADDLGKTPGKDARAHKATYPALYGVEATRQRASLVYQAACRALDPVEESTTTLRLLARLVLERRA